MLALSEERIICLVYAIWVLLSQKRSTRPYKDTCLDIGAQETCSESEISLHLMEKWVNKQRLVFLAILRRNICISLPQTKWQSNEESIDNSTIDNRNNSKSKALKSPAETRWLSFYTMVEAISVHRNLLEEEIEKVCPENEQAVALVELAKKRSSPTT
uniref:Uncharacterized protein n=1 Tax=Ditylenchus dipsaci TaxID=166011 RepID=A0A915CP64_9BILA